LTSRAVIPHPPEHSWQTLRTRVISPRSGDGRQDQFWVQMAESSANFQGIGVSKVPPMAPPTNC